MWPDIGRYLKSALRQLVVKPLRLLISVDEPVVRSCQNGDGQFQRGISCPVVGVDPQQQTALLGGCPDLRRPQSHLDGKISVKMRRNGRRRKEHGDDLAGQQTAEHRRDRVAHGIADDTKGRWGHQCRIEPHLGVIVARMSHDDRSFDAEYLQRSTKEFGLRALAVHTRVRGR